MKKQKAKRGAPLGPRNGKAKANVNIRTDFDKVMKWRMYCRAIDPKCGQKIVFDRFCDSLPDL